MKFSSPGILLPIACVCALGCGSSNNLTPPDFSLAAAPGAITMQSGGSAQLLSVTVGSVGSFNNSVTVSLSGLPAGVTATPSALTVAPGQLGQFQLTASGSASAPTATITATATSGAVSHMATAALTITPAPVPDFTLSAAPGSLSLQGGGSSHLLSITVGSVQGFTGAVNVSLSGLPAGVTATPSTLSVTPGQIGQFQLTASGSVTASTVTITATGTAGSLSHGATAALTVTPAVVPDFTLAVAPGSMSLRGGTSRMLNITVGSLEGFTDAVDVSLNNLPAGVTVTPATLSLTPGQLGQFQLTASTVVSASTDTITATATAGAISHATTAALTITPAALPDFTLSAAPASISLQGGGSARLLSVTASAVNGFTDPVNLSLSGLPAGVTATPATLSVIPGQLGQFTLTASNSAAATSSATVTVTGSADSLSHTATAALSITPAVSNASIDTTSYDFGNNLVGTTLTKSVVNVTNTGTTSITLSPSLSGDPSYSIATASTCGTTLATGASCSESINYLPTTASSSSPQTATLNLGLGNVPAGTAQTVSLTGVSAALPQGTVSQTNNPQVALYTMTLPFPGSVTVNFGTDTTYGRQTWTQSTAQAGGTVSIYVAGMLANTAYHMQAAVQLQNGITANDVDHTFTSGTPLVTPNLTVIATPGLTPQSGLEQLTNIIGSKGIVVTDLQGNVLWTYALPNSLSADDIEGVKLLPNGHFLMTIDEGSTAGFPAGGPPPPAGAIIAIREIDLAGNIVREISTNDLTSELQAAGHNFTLRQFHHEITPLPNGHWLVLANITQSYPAGTFADYPSVTSVLGDVIIDLDQNLQPVWVWNEFDHLDVTRHPMSFPDWTHTNAIVYTPDDHNILVSIRHQNWVVKVDYQDGTGTGNILWRLGQGGDFTLQGGTDPTDWQYAQHDPSIVGPNSAGIFSLILMDNGDDRLFPDGGLCGTGSEPACYTTVPVFQINETTMTATVTFRQNLAPTLYNSWGGNAEPMQNGDYEYDVSGLATGSDIFEVTPDNTNPTTVWHMHVTGSNAYRGFRIPSLYPGVQW